jgi:hypothetical protein
MRGRLWIALGVALGFGVLAPPALARDRTVVELYTSQGCEECWRANVAVSELARRPEVLALTFPVSYWDHLGWKDTFARPEFTARQTIFRRAFGLRTLQTPQVVIDGAAHVSGLDREQLHAVLRGWRRNPPRAADIRIVWDGARVVVKSGRAPTGGAEVWLVRYDPRWVNVAVTRGENRGRNVPHRNVVKQLVRLGPWTGRGRSYALPPIRSGLRDAIIVQAVRDGRILAVEAP